MKVTAVRITDTDVDRIIELYGHRGKNRKLLLRESIKDLGQPEIKAKVQKVEGTYVPTQEE